MPDGLCCPAFLFARPCIRMNVRAVDFRGHSSVGRAVALQAIGLGFESPCLQVLPPWPDSSPCPILSRVRRIREVELEAAPAPNTSGSCCHPLSLVAASNQKPLAFSLAFVCRLLCELAYPSWTLGSRFLTFGKARRSHNRFGKWRSSGCISNCATNRACYFFLSDFSIFRSEIFGPVAQLVRACA